MAERQKRQQQIAPADAAAANGKERRSPLPGDRGPGRDMQIRGTSAQVNKQACLFPLFAFLGFAGFPPQTENLASLSQWGGDRDGFALESLLPQSGPGLPLPLCSLNHGCGFLKRRRVSEEPGLHSLLLSSVF